jgi:hypothetical protein
MSERVFIDVKVNAARSSGYYVRCPQLKQAIEKIENFFNATSSRRVVGIVYSGENTIELILDPPIGNDDDE